jgi:uncharacterized protein DUF6325
MASLETAADAEEALGPIDFVAIELPDGQVSAPGLEALLDLTGRGVIAILDLEFIGKDPEGAVKRLHATDLPPRDGVDLRMWDDASAELLDDDDIAHVGAELRPGGVAVVVVFENRWVQGMVDTWRQDGARLIGEGGIGVEDVVAALHPAGQR